MFLWSFNTSEEIIYKKTTATNNELKKDALTIEKPTDRISNLVSTSETESSFVTKKK